MGGRRVVVSDNTCCWVKMADGGFTSKWKAEELLLPCCGSYEYSENHTVSFIIHASKSVKFLFISEIVLSLNS